jgi:hypothetical protein
MEGFNFETLKKEIYYKLIYPENILATKQEAMEILKLSSYYFNKLRKKLGLHGLQASGYNFYFKEELFDYIKEMKEQVPHINNFVDFNYDNIEDRIGIILVYPKDKLFTRKTGPTYLSMTSRTFDDLRKNREFTEYEYLGVKFFNKEEIKMWKEKRRPHLKILSKPEYYTMKVKK